MKIGTTCPQLAQSIFVKKLSFEDDETPRNGASTGLSTNLVSNMFLKKERKNLSDSTPSRRVKESASADFQPTLVDLETRRK